MRIVVDSLRKYNDGVSGIMPDGFQSELLVFAPDVAKVAAALQKDCTIYREGAEVEGLFAMLAEAFARQCRQEILGALPYKDVAYVGIIGKIQQDIVAGNQW